MNKEKISFQDKLDTFIKQHKLAILSTLVVHAFFFLALVFFQISTNDNSQSEIFEINFIEDLELPKELKDKVMVENKNEEQNTEDLKNIAVNETDKNKSTDDYYNEFQEIVNKSKGKETFKAEEYEDKRWLIKDHSKDFEFNPNENKNEENKNNNSSENKGTYAGKTIISYNLEGRKATRLPVPAYQCVGSGEVIVSITVNQNGLVTSAQVLSSTTPAGETCLPEAAKKAALKSKFTINLSAPNNQKGTITYKFVAQ